MDRRASGPPAPGREPNGHPGTPSAASSPAAGTVGAAGALCPPGSPAAPLLPRLCRTWWVSTGALVPRAALAMLGPTLATLQAPASHPRGSERPRPRREHRAGCRQGASPEPASPGTASTEPRRAWAARSTAAKGAGCSQPGSCPSMACSSVLSGTWQCHGGCRERRRVPTGAAGMPPIPPVPLAGTNAPAGAKHNACAGSILPALAPQLPPARHGPPPGPATGRTVHGGMGEGQRGCGSGDGVGSLLCRGSTGVAQPPAPGEGGLQPGVASARPVPESRRVWVCR